MLLSEVATTSLAVAGVSGKRAKAELLAGCLRAADPGELPAVVAWLTGQTRQRRTGLGWASLGTLPPAAPVATLTVTEVDAAFATAQSLSGSGSQAARRAVLERLFAAATEPEQRLLAGLVSGELRQGAQEGLLLEAVAVAAALPAVQVRRAVTLSGDLAAVARAALHGGPGALDSFGLQVGRPLAPMLAASAPDLPAAVARTGPAGVEWKLDGVRVQVHRDGDDVAVFTRTLDDITARVPEVVAAARSWPLHSAVLDGEVLLLTSGGRPQPFQVTSSRVATGGGTGAGPLSTFLFDLLHLDGADLVDIPAAARRAALATAVPAPLLVPRLEVTDVADPAALTGAQGFAADALARGHEGVVVKSLTGGYAMGRRGAGWVKVKPRLTLDLVVLAAEWGHGRRTGTLSNLHLGARDPDGRYGPPGGFVMLGKTFKGLTDAMLAWQTGRLQELATGGNRWRVDVRPELVVEVAFDGVQTSPRYPAGLALRFARVLAHRPDKPASQANTIEDVRRHHPDPV
ncbi:MAG TPA: ATP-dependent DNA ligase [Kineosporiaceae bacterium]|nr:ATP-dependent DNA ligase [Kineosporiaceae bacterium]